MARVRKFVAAFNNSPNAKAAFKARMKTAGVKPKVLIQEVETRWWATYMCCERLLELRPFLDVDGIDQLVGEYLNPEDWEYIVQVCEIMEPFKHFIIFFEGQKYVSLSWLPVMIEKMRLHMEKVAADLEDPNSERRRRRGLRDQPRLTDLLIKCVHEMRESFLLYWRSRDDKFECGRESEIRMSGIPTKAWHAALYEGRTRKRLGFLTADERTQLWKMLADDVFDRHLALLAENAEAETDEEDANAAAPANPPPQPPIDLHARQANNPLFMDFDLFNVVEDQPVLRRQHPDEHAAIKSAIQDEIMRLQRHERLFMAANPLDEWRNVASEFPYTAPVARAILAIPSTVRLPFFRAFVCSTICFVAQGPLC
jgi:hypothetical protein